MKLQRYMIAVLAIVLLPLSAGDISAWDPRWQFKQETRTNDYGTGIKSIEMQKRYHYDSMKKFQGTTDISNGYTVMRNLNGEIMRGYINKDGQGLLQDQAGNFYRVNAR
jgi:hypothetical protein